MTDSRMHAVVAGGGVVGLSIAWRLSRLGVRVTLVERGELGREASWAGAGILYGGDPELTREPFGKLLAYSGRLHRQWATELRELTGIDNGHRPCGSMIPHFTEADEAAFEPIAAVARREGSACERLSGDQARHLEPALAGDLLAAHRFPDTCQVRNPRHIKALTAACAAGGVEIRSGCPVLRVATRGGAAVGLETADGTIPADSVVVAAGAWTEFLLADLGAALPTKPVRGQIVLLNTQRPILRPILEVGARYVVPRPDGRVLIGSTEEDVGFLKRNTPDALRELIEFACRLVPDLGQATFEQAWSGLRPGNRDGKPYIGRLPSVANLWVAAGHLRNGLQNSTGTAHLLADLMLGRPPALPSEPFAPDRA